MIWIIRLVTRKLFLIFSLFLSSRCSSRLYTFPFLLSRKWIHHFTFFFLFSFYFLCLGLIELLIYARKHVRELARPMWNWARPAWRQLIFYPSTEVSFGVDRATLCWVSCRPGRSTDSIEAAQDRGRELRPHVLSSPLYVFIHKNYSHWNLLFIERSEKRRKNNCLHSFKSRN